MSGQGSRWRRSQAVGELVKIQRAILDAKDEVDAARAAEIRTARENVRLTLLSQGLVMASVAVRICGEAGVSFHDFKSMNEAMRAGGFHRVRLTGGRNLDG